MKLKKSTKSSLITVLGIALAYVILTVMKSFGLLTHSLMGQLVPICAYVLMALSLNLTVGILGELSLGHAGFMSIGAFTGATVAMSLISVIESGTVRFIIAVVAGGALAAIFGFLIGIPVLRLKGDYLAIVTLAFGEIIKTVLTVLYVGVDSRGLHMSLKSSEALGLEEGGKMIINGAMGAVGIRKISTFTAGFILIILAVAIISTFVDSRAGRAVMAIRDNRIAAESVGIPITKYKMIAFVISAAIAGVAGVLYALNISTVNSTQFNYDQSILILVFVVLGGIGSMRGSIIAAILLTLLPELLREFESLRMLVYAIVLIIVMIVRNNATAKLYTEKFTRAVRGVLGKLAVKLKLKKKA